MGFGNIGKKTVKATKAFSVLGRIKELGVDEDKTHFALIEPLAGLPAENGFKNWDLGKGKYMKVVLNQMDPSQSMTDVNGEKKTGVPQQNFENLKASSGKLQMRVGPAKAGDLITLSRMEKIGLTDIKFNLTKTVDGKTENIKAKSGADLLYTVPLYKTGFIRVHGLPTGGAGKDYAYDRTKNTAVFANKVSPIMTVIDNQDEKVSRLVQWGSSDNVDFYASSKADIPALVKSLLENCKKNNAMGLAFAARSLNDKNAIVEFGCSYVSLVNQNNDKSDTGFKEKSEEDFIKYVEEKIINQVSVSEEAIGKIELIGGIIYMTSTQKEEIKNTDAKKNFLKNMHNLGIFNHANQMPIIGKAILARHLYTSSNDSEEKGEFATSAEMADTKPNYAINYAKVDSVVERRHLAFVNWNPEYEPSPAISDTAYEALIGENGLINVVKDNPTRWSDGVSTPMSESDIHDAIVKYASRLRDRTPGMHNKMIVGQEPSAEIELKEVEQMENHAPVGDFDDDNDYDSAPGF